MILSAMQSASVRLMGQRPSAFFGASQNFPLEIADLVNEVAADIVASNDWQALTKVHTIAGNGALTEFDLPDDYDRMLVKSDVQDRAYWFWGYAAFTDINEYLFQEERGFQPFPGGWIIYGDKMRFTPAPQSEAVFPYISSCYARAASTFEIKCEFDSDTDSFLLPERLLTLGLVWRWRENKKLDFTGDQEAFTKALSEYAGRDKGSRRLSRSSYRSMPGVGLAYPYELG